MKSSLHLPREGLLLLLIVVLGWGLSWTVIKYSIAEIPPLSFRGVSAVFGGFCLLMLARLNGLSVRLPAGVLPRLLVLAFINITGWNALSTYGVLYLPSGRAALLAYTMPLWCVPLSVWWLGESLSARRIVALLLGLVGVAVLMGEGAHAIMASPVGVLLMVSAALCWACGVVLFKRWNLRVPTLVLTGWLLMLGGVPLLLAALVVDGLPQRVPGNGALFGLCFSALITFMLCNWSWNRLVLLVPVSVSSLSSLLVPLVSVASGALFLGEQPGWREALAALLILGSVAVINSSPRGARHG
ncbi:EamA family transporter [Uliginosibacterium sp. 31-16]|uniref:DMT family transporter n=1 Tax=Uliginosibacterium sp. 31-16 TaxID=3068315 RepID=UPI00273E5262|nr:EamA family transporter [Uliginosibacterium sp. 31-16]MDP5239959.1 EamA family transporter [Uliginosibacterium sp. 31-16]